MVVSKQGPLALHYKGSLESGRVLPARTRWEYDFLIGSTGTSTCFRII